MEQSKMKGTSLSFLTISSALCFRNDLKEEDTKTVSTYESNSKRSSTIYSCLFY